MYLKNMKWFQPALKEFFFYHTPMPWFSTLVTEKLFRRAHGLGFYFWPTVGMTRFRNFRPQRQHFQETL